MRGDQKASDLDLVEWGNATLLEEEEEEEEEEESAISQGQCWHSCWSVLSPCD